LVWPWLASPYLYGWKALDPITQVIGQDQCATTALNCTQGAGFNRFIESRFASAGDSACFGYGVGKWRIHLDLNNC
jgi:hypothetical protein